MPDAPYRRPPASEGVMPTNSKLIVNESANGAFSMSNCSAVSTWFCWSLWANWVFKRRVFHRPDALGNFTMRKALLVKLVLRRPMRYYTYPRPKPISRQQLSAYLGRYYWRFGQPHSILQVLPHTQSPPFVVAAMALRLLYCLFYFYPHFRSKLLNSHAGKTLNGV